jgi:hypothetical protein
MYHSYKNPKKAIHQHVYPDEAPLKMQPHLSKIAIYSSPGFIVMSFCTSHAQSIRPTGNNPPHPTTIKIRHA